MTTSPKVRFLGLLTLILSLCFASRFFLLSLRGFELFNSDHAIIGLMGRHILKGQWMIYYYGQGYMGSLEAFVAAVFIRLIGSIPLAVQMAPLTFFTAFLVVNFYFLKRTVGLLESFLANLWLAMGSINLAFLSVMPLGGYPETYFFGALITGLALGAFRHRAIQMHYFLTGLCVGVGYWVNPLLLLILFPLGLHLALSSDFWKSLRPQLHPKRVLFLEGLPIPNFLRWAGILIHLWIFFFILTHSLAFFFGPGTLHFGAFSWTMPDPPFLVKKVKHVIWLLCGETAALFVLLGAWRRLLTAFRTFWPLMLGLLLGASLVIIHSLLDLPGYRLIHGSGLVHFKNLPAHVHLVLVQNLGTILLGPFPKTPLPLLCSLAKTFHVILWIGIFLRAFWRSRSSLSDFMTLRPMERNSALLPFNLFLFVLAVCLLNALESARYLSPLYFALAWLIAIEIGSWKKFRMAACSLLFVGLIAWPLCQWRVLGTLIPAKTELATDYKTLLQKLSEEDIQGGYADYWTSYLLTFLAGETIIFAPYRSLDRYPSYTQYVDNLSKVAYVFTNKTEAESFEHRLKTADLSYQSFSMKSLYGLWIDRSQGSEKQVIS